MTCFIKHFDTLTINELYKILEVRCTVFVVEQTCIYQDVDGKDQDAYHVFMVEDETITAYLRILKKGICYSEVSIGRVLVANSSRGRGLAKEIMLKAISYIEEELNEHTIRISAQEYLKGFYSSLGF